MIEPFGFLRAGIKSTVTGSSPPPNQSTPQKIGRIISNIGPSEDTIAVVESKAQQKVEQIVPQLVSTLGLNQFQFQKITRFACLAFIAMACFMLYARSDFLNIVLAAISYYCVTIDRVQLESKMRYIAGLYIVSFLYDLIWLAFNGTVFLKNRKIKGFRGRNKCGWRK